MRIKYSIIIPTYNSSKYLKTCIDSVLISKNKNFELLISNNQSTDNTEDIILSYKDSRIKYIKPDSFLDRCDHWDFALSKASGEWLLFLGTDDALMPYFFELNDKLTTIADINNLNIIRTDRAYYFWPGCEEVYGHFRVQYYATSKIEIRSMSEIINSALYLNPADFFNIPQMYTTSMFNRRLINKAKKNSKNGKILVKNPTKSQDGYLSCIAFGFEKQYLNCCIPMAWVGSSSNSAGLTETKIHKSFTEEGENNTPNEANSFTYLNSTQYLLFQNLKIFFDNSKSPNIKEIELILKNKFKLFESIFQNNYYHFHQYSKYEFDEMSKIRLEYFRYYCNINGINPNDIIKKIQKQIENNEVYTNDLKKIKRSFFIRILIKVFRPLLNLYRFLFVLEYQKYQYLIEGEPIDLYYVNSKIKKSVKIWYLIKKIKIR